MKINAAIIKLCGIASLLGEKMDPKIKTNKDEECEEDKDKDEEEEERRRKRRRRR